MKKHQGHEGNQGHKEIRSALILCAGLGTRLRPLTDVRAKPAMPVAGEPMIRRIASWLVSNGVDDLVVNLHHRPETITAVLGDGRDLGGSGPLFVGVAAGVGQCGRPASRPPDRRRRHVFHRERRHPDRRRSHSARRARTPPPARSPRFHWCPTATTCDTAAWRWTGTDASPVSSAEVRPLKGPGTSSACRPSPSRARLRCGRAWRRGQPRSAASTTR